MTQPDPIDQILGELRRTMGNTLMMMDICMQLRRNSAHLLQLVRTMLAELGNEIARAVPMLPEEPAEGDEQDIT
jgi:hypothetical protein